MAWTNDTQPFGSNRVPILTGWASDDSGVGVPVAVDKATGRVLVSATVTVTSGTLSTIYYGQASIVTTGTAVQLASHSLDDGVVVEALSSNTSSVYVGDSSVTASNGLELPPGSSVSLPVGNTNLLYINGASGQAVSFLGG
jgi:hypothetical protein